MWSMLIYRIIKVQIIETIALVRVSKSKKTLFNVGQCKQYNISSHLKWVLVADKNGCTIHIKYIGYFRCIGYDGIILL